MKPYKYAFWNNKGGVGKTFLCFAVASEYARKHPDVNVVVIDMCPQANVSEILLGGNGSGNEKLQRLLKKRDKAQTIGGYFYQRIRRPHEKMGTEIDFVVPVKKFNPSASENLHLIVGDPSLESQVRTINNIVLQDIPADAWCNVRSWVRDLQDAAAAYFGEENCVFFIDCNPSFSSYTEQALLAADRLIVPCTADGSSARAISNVGRLVYGHEELSIYEKASFSHKAREEFSMTLPRMHLVPMNRTTTNRKNPASAFGKMFESIKDRVRNQMKSLPNDFTRTDDGVFINIPDVHSASIIASYHGIPIQELRSGKKYLVKEKSEKPSQVNQTSLKQYQKAIQELVSLL